METACTDKPMLSVTSDAHTILSTKFGMCSYCQISLLTGIHPDFTYTSYASMVILHVSSWMAADQCAMSTT